MTPAHRGSAKTETAVSPPMSERLAQLQIIICCGAGGVGKTTMASALALSAAVHSDKRVLVITVDPAQRLAAALGIERMGIDPSPISRARLRKAGLELSGEVSAAMLDQKSVWDRVIERYAPDRQVARRILQSRFYQGISDSFIGGHEYAAIETLYEIHEANEYDLVVVDTPPSRSALDLLEAPQRTVDFISAKVLSWLARPGGLSFKALNFASTPFLRLADRLLGSELLSDVGQFVADLQSLYTGFQERARDVNRMLRSPRVGFVVVSTPEPAPFSEAEFFLAKLNQMRMPARALIMNRVLPDYLSDRETLHFAEMLDETGGRKLLKPGTAGDVAALRRMSRNYSLLARAAQRDARQLLALSRLHNVAIARVPLLTEPVSDLHNLANLAAML